jgi:hypothetical protein
MFNLDAEIDALSNRVYASRCRNAAHVAELRDHLYCEIEQLRARGMSDEQAFAAASAKFGAGSAFASELAKNLTPVELFCEWAARYDRGIADPRWRSVFIAHGAIWAVVMLAAAIAIKHSHMSEGWSWLFTTMMIPLWYASEQVLRDVLSHRSQGGAR